MFVKFPSITKLLDVLGSIKYAVQATGTDEKGAVIYDESRKLPCITFTSTVKVHGTNGALVKHADGSITYQSRERILSVEDDNCGFAAFMEKIGKDTLNRVYFEPLEQQNPGISYPIAVFGEYAGQGGATKKVAVAKVPKFFMTFAVHTGVLEENSKNWLPSKKWAHLRDLSLNLVCAYDFPVKTIVLDFNNLDASLALLEEETLAVENECPVGAYFGQKGVGEGRVWVCDDPSFQGSRYWFKTKGPKHSQSKTRSETSLDQEKYAHVAALVEEYLTQARFERAIAYLGEAGKPVNKASTGDFVNWVCTDIVKEAASAMAESGIDAQSVHKQASKSCAKWYFTYLADEAGLSSKIAV